MNAIEPFKSNAEYIQAEIDFWLRPRCRRLAADRDADQFRTLAHNETRAAEADRLAAAAKLAEHEGRAALDARLAAHRENGNSALGLDRLCSRHDLNADARAALLCMTVCALSSEMAEQVFEGVSGYVATTMTPATIAKVLDIGNVEGHVLRVRPLFLPESPLLRVAKLDDRRESDVPEEVHGLFVRLTEATFRVIFGLDR